MATIDRITNSPEETTALGRELASRLTPPVLVLLSGDLGSGKTTLTKGIVSGLGGAQEEDVTSPTFTLVHVFKMKNRTQSESPDNSKIYHVDLYRCEDFHDVETLALEDALSEPAIVIIEWSERFSLRSDWPRIVIRLEHLQGDTRHIVISEPSQLETDAPQLSGRE
jgi:tRNA threonylcarbamoyladenosine biosynthesis protein TsaE